ncbi:hypothetical protein HDV02_005329 [Globomyces sp. JEL0801]|nr:hypothetical protein HDV02_005329 [Globomyces sp. JEL0801]
MPEPVVDEVPPIDGAIKPSQSDSPVTEQSPTATTAVEQQEILESVTTAIVTEEPKEIDVETMIEPQLTLQPQKSAKHEAALAELKNFITTVLSGKLEEIKASITQRITEKDEKVTVPGHEAKTSHDQKPKVEEEKKKAPVKGKK